MFSYLSKKLCSAVSPPRPSSGRSKFYNVQEVDLEIRDMLRKITHLQRCIQDLGDQMDYSLFESIEDNLKMYSIYHSNAIEGSKLSLANTVSFLQDDIIEYDDSVRDHMDALGHAAAIGLFGSASSTSDKVNRILVCGVNDLLTKHTASHPTGDEDTSGAYKMEDNSIQQEDGEMHKFVMPGKVPQEMEELFSHCDVSNMHPVVKAAVAHYNFTRIHPFQHGNGGGARILLNLILQHYNLPPAIIQVQNKAQYLECLHTADQGDIMPFVSFVASSLIDTMEMILAAYKAECNAMQQISLYKDCIKGRRALPFQDIMALSLPLPLPLPMLDKLQPLIVAC